MVPLSYAFATEHVAIMMALGPQFFIAPKKEQIQALFTLFKILQSPMLISKPLSYATKRFSRNQVYEIYSFTTLRNTN